MAALMPIGDFARMTHLSVKTLRHYHDVRLLEPASVDPASGYRYYAAAQVPIALAIRRFRDLDMPIDQVRAVLEAPDPATRTEAIITHLTRMEDQLEQTQLAISSLRVLLEDSSAHPSIEFRRVDPTPAIGVRAVVDWDDTEDWLAETFDGLRASLPNSTLRAGADGALFPSEFFEAHRGEVVAFIPASGPFTPAPPVEQLEVPPAHLAIIVHEGTIDDLDQSYAELGTFVLERGLGTEGPIRENYLITNADTTDPARLRTEVCWPTVSRPGC